MKKGFLVFIGILISVQFFAQTGIGTTTPDASAKLDVTATNKGFLPPRVTLTSATDNTTIPNAAEGLLVYNKGSVALQAGYYYWNGANWATIATATSAGNGVTAMDMVKLYGEAWSSASGKIGNTNGYTFTVPVSGRYLFDFSSTTYGSTGFTINFYVRQGTTNLGSDGQVSTNNGVRAEYNGKVEVNLQSGTTYNVYVSSNNPNRGAEDYDRVYYKLVAGNLPVTGQTVDYVAVQASADLSPITANTAVKFNTILAGNIPYDPSTGLFTLTAGKTYRLTGMVTLGTQAAGTGTAAEANIVWRTGTAASGTNIGNYGQILSGNSTYNGNGQGVVDAIYTPTSNTTVLLFVNGIGSTVAFRGGYTNAIIEQIGSSAIVNPWTLSGTNTYNTTGNVGIGTNAPTEKLDVAGTLAVSGTSTLKDLVKIGTGIGDEGGEINFAVPQTNTTLSTRVVQDVWQNRLRFFDGNTKGVFIDLDKAPTGVSGEISYKASGIINSGSFVQLDNVKAGPTRTGAGGGYAGLSIGAVSTTFVADVSAMYSNSTVGGTSITGVSYTTTGSNSFNGWGFLPGQQSTYILNDTTNNRVYRIILMIGSSYNNNFISIERLH